MNNEQPWEIEFYKDNRGTSPVEDFLNGLQPPEKAKAYMYLKLLREFGVRLSMPYAKDLKGHKPLWELRPHPNRLIYFAHTGRKFIILHGFPKKRNKTSKLDIAAAERNRKEYLEREAR